MLIFFIFFPVSYAFSEVNNPLTLDEAVNLALEYNLSLRKAEIDLASSGLSESNLWAEIFPSINASASAGYRNSLFSGAEISGSGFNYSVGLGVNFGLNAGIPYTMRSIRLAHTSNLLRIEDARNQLSIQVTKYFFALVAERSSLLFYEEVLNLAQRQLTRSETMFRNGLTGELSLTQSRLSLENARFNLSAARISHNNSMAEFLAMLGMEAHDYLTDENLDLSGEIRIVKIEANAEELIDRYLAHRPDIVRSNQEIERLSLAQMQTYLQSRAPSINLSVDWSSSSFSPFTDLLSATARLSIPIDSWIPGTSRAMSASRSMDAVEKARLDLQITENSARAQIRSLTSLLRGSWDSILIARLSLQAAQRGYQLTEMGFNSGTVEALVLHDARNNMTNARQRLLQAELSYFNMILDLSSALNMDWKELIELFGVQGE